MSSFRVPGILIVKLKRKREARRVSSIIEQKKKNKSQAFLFVFFFLFSSSFDCSACKGGGEAGKFKEP